MISVGQFLVGGRELPILGVKTRVNIEDISVQVTQTERFQNTNSSSMNVEYKIELPPGCVVSSFCNDAGGSRLELSVKKKGSGSSSSSSSSSSSDMNCNSFSIPLGSLPPKAEVIVTITYELLAQLVDGSIVLILEGSDGRKITFSDPSQRAAVNDSRANPGFDFSAHVRTSSSAISRISSPSHSITTERHSSHEATVRLADNSQLLSQNGFVLCIVEESGLSKGEPLVVTQKCGNQTMVMMSIPYTEEETMIAGEMVVVLDRSGSMCGEEIELAKRTLDFFLHALRPGVVFNVIDFASDFTHFSSSSVDYNQTTLNKSVEYVNQISAGGGTNIFDPLKCIFEQKTKPGFPRQVFIITDGAVENRDKCVELVKQNADNTRLFAIGIGSGADETLIQHMALAGGGSYEMIADASSIRECVMRLLAHAYKSGINKINVGCYGPDGQQINVPMFPSKPSPVFSGGSVDIFFYVPQSVGNVKLSLGGQGSGSSFNREIPVDVTKETLPGNQITKIGARKIISDYSSDSGISQDTIANMSVAAQVPSPFTEFSGTGSNGVTVSPVMNTPCPSQPHIIIPKGSDPNHRGTLTTPKQPDDPVLDKIIAQQQASGCFNDAALQLLGVPDSSKKAIPALAPTKPVATASASVQKTQTLLEAITMELEELESQSQLSSDEEYKQFFILSRMKKKYEQQLKNAEKESPPEEKPAVASDPQLAQKVWTTLLTLAGLKKKYATREGEWGFLALKSEEWARSNLKGSYDSWKSAAEQMIK